MLAGLAIAVLGALCAAPSAEGYRLGGKRWPGATIPYYSSATQYAWSVKQAVGAWNESGARIRFVRVPRSRARLIIKVVPSGGGESGSAPLGYTPCALYRNRRCAKPWVGTLRLSPGYDRWSMARTAAHELGHVLGLRHEDRRCALMNSLGNAWGGERCQAEGVRGKWRCRILELDDAKGAVRRYGGRARAPRPDPMCWVDPPPAPPSALVVTPDPPGAFLRVQWQNPLRVRDGGKVALARGAGACPTTPGDDPLEIPIFDETTSTYDESRAVPPGRHCIAAWSIDKYGQRSSTPALAWVELVDTLAPPIDLAAVQNPPNGASVMLRWRNPAYPRTRDIVIKRRADTCPTSANDPAAATLLFFGFAESGELSEAFDWDLPSGRYCYALWSRDLQADRVSAQAATVVVDYVAP